MTRIFRSRAKQAVIPLVVAMLAVLVSSPALAAAAAAPGGGLEAGKTMLDNVSTWMTGVGVTVVTIALMFVGARMVFQAAEWKDVAPVFWGGVLIGGAATIAGMLVP